MEDQEHQIQFRGCSSTNHAGTVRMIENTAPRLLKVGSSAIYLLCKLEWDLNGHNHATFQGARAR
jgi:hypothetical protein